MENENRLKNMVFKYLDGLFENINIQKDEYGIRGEVGNNVLFSYDSKTHRIYFNLNKIRTIRDMFDISERTVIEYILYYLSINVKRTLISARLFPIL